jgi:uncharacterized membrane protein
MLTRHTKFFTGLLSLFLFIGVLLPAITSAQELYNPYQGTWKAKTLEVLDTTTQEIGNTVYETQTLSAELLQGPEKGTVITVANDFQTLRPGNKFYVNHNVFVDGSEAYTFLNVARQGPLILLLIIFALTIIAFGAWQGVRSLIALVVSFLAIIFILIPGILNGWNPLLASFLVAGAVLFAAIFFTHGFNRESLVAYGGTMTAVVLAGLFAIFAVQITKLTGFAAEESVYLNFNTGGTINFTALLLGAFIIGFLGVLDDIAITQSAVVTELYQSNPNMSQREVYTRAMRVGREHVGALVNTLVLAYTGASLPLLLYFKLSAMNIGATMNLEIIATEVVRIIVGSIGLILTVPLVTFLAVKYLKGYTPKHSHHGHHHGHHH